jgi:tyrosine aminotransferase/nicotianamine aminotransferase
MATDGGEKGSSGHAAAEWRFARAAAAKEEGALAVAGDKMSIRAARFKISASVDARDPRPVLPLAHGDPSVFPAFRTAAEAEDAVAAALRTGKFNCYPAGVGLPDARRYARFRYSKGICLYCTVYYSLHSKW